MINNNIVKKNMLFYQFLIFCLLYLNPISCSHYRGVVATSEWNANGATINFKAQMYYKLSSSVRLNVFCSDSYIQNQVIVRDPSDIIMYLRNCSVNGVCYSNIYQFQNSFTCSSFSNSQDWSIVDKIESISLPGIAENEYANIYFLSDGGAWTGFNIGYSWSHVSQKVKNKNGNWNTPPKTKAFPTYEVVKGCPASLKIPIEDPDGDIIRCRPSVSLGKFGTECESCSFIYSIALDKDTCTLIIPSNLTRSTIIEIQIEDFQNASSTNPMSSVPLQFAVTLINKVGQVCDVPEFTKLVPPYDSCIAVATSASYEGIFELISVSNISEINLNAFTGLTKSNLKYESISKTWFINYTIRVTYSNLKLETITAYATNKLGFSSEYRKLNYLLNYEPPRVIQIDTLGNICKSASGYIWKFLMNRDVSSPSSPSFIRFMRAFNQSTYIQDYQFDTFSLRRRNFTSFSISTPSSVFQVNRNYSILLDFGAVITEDFCKPQSDAISSFETFKFIIVEDTGTEFTFTSNIAQYTNGSLVKILWKLENAIKLDCFLKYNNQSYSTVPCSDDGIDLRNLQSGAYSFYVKYSTRCTALKSSSEIKWTVINAKPNVTLSTQGYQNGLASDKFLVKINCTHVLPCIVYCRFVLSSNLGATFNQCLSDFKPAFALNNSQSYTFSVYAVDSLGNQANTINIQFKAKTIAPMFNSSLINLEINCGSLIPTVATYDEVDLPFTLNYTDKYFNPCSLLRTWRVYDSLGNMRTFDQTIRYLSNTKLSYVDRIFIPCVTNKQVIEDLKYHKGFIVLENNQCNTSLILTAAIPLLPLDDCDFSFSVMWTSIRDSCMGTYPNVEQNVIVGVREIPYSPFHMQKDVTPKAVFFKWPIDRNSRLNEVYLLESKEDDEATLVASTINSNYVTLMKDLKQNQVYFWNVVYTDATNSSIKRITPFWEFKTKLLANLALEKIVIPIESVVGSKIQISWIVRNEGNATTSNYLWYDAVFGSAYDELSKSSLLGTVKQQRYTEPQGQYSATFTFQIDERYAFDYFYIYVKVDYYNYLDDSDYTNNMFPYPSIVKILPVPLPNLTPKSISLNPDFGKAGEDFEIKIVVENNGDGSTKINSFWNDLIEIKLYNSRSIYRSVVNTGGVFSSKSSYVIDRTLTLPLQYYGDAFLTVTVNVDDKLYEASKDNKTLTKLFNIFSPDTANLLIEIFPANLNVKTGSTLRINYTVINDGNAVTNVFQWYDFMRIISTTTNKEVFTKRIDVYSILRPGEKYDQSVEFYINPSTPSGNYKIKLGVDEANNVFSIFENEKNIETNLIIQLVKPYWTVNDLNVKSEFLNNSINFLKISYSISIDYPYERESELIWTDVFYISDLSSFNQNSASKIGEFNHKLLANNTITHKSAVDLQFILSNSLSGKYYVFVFIDEYQLIDKFIDLPSSNAIDKPVQINKIPGLVNITSLDLVREITETQNGYAVLLLLNIENIGNIPVTDPQFKFSVQTATSTSIFLLNYKINKILLPQSTTNETVALYISFQLYGRLTIILKNDDNSYNLHSSSIKSREIFIEQAQSPDLVVKTLDYKTGLLTQNNCDDNIFLVNVTYTIQNIAYSMDKLRTWTDRLDITCNTIGALFSKQVSVTKQLRSQETYSNTYEMTTDLWQFDLVSCKATVNTNLDNGAIELFNLNNNKNEKCCFSVPKREEARFELTLLAVISSEWQAGDVYQVDYSMKNGGKSSKYTKNSWKDSLFFHKNKNDSLENIIKNGIIIGERSFSGFELACSQQSFENFTIKTQIPITFSGLYYLHLIHDLQGSNLNLSSFVASRSQVNVIPIEPCDIAASNGTIVSTTSKDTNMFTAGDEIVFSFDVLNLAPGKARGSWYDAIYLSKFPSASPNEIRLLSIARKQELFQFEYYRVNISLLLPFTLRAGVYYIVFVTDTVKVLKDLNPDNNEDSIMITIEELPSVDIFISNTTLNTYDVSRLNFSWYLNSDQKSKGKMCETYYLSEDSSYNFGDFEFENEEKGFCRPFEISEVGIGIHNIRTLPIIPLLPDGVYNGLVRVVTNIAETNLDNNVGVGDAKVAVEALSLEIDQYSKLLIWPKGNNLFKIEPGVDVNTLKIELKTSSQDAYNDIFIQVNEIPSENYFISKSRIPFSFNQSVLVKYVRPEKYYLLIKPFMATSMCEYMVTVYIKNVKEIDIDSIEPKKLSVLGRNTLKLIGNFVPQKLNVCLVYATNPNNIALCTLKVYKKNVEIIFATFDLKNTTISESERFYVTVNNKSSLEFVETITGDIGVSTIEIDISRRIYRPNEAAYADIIVRNNGDTDVFVPALFISTFSNEENKNCTSFNSITFICPINSIYSTTTTIQKPVFKFVGINNNDYPPYGNDYLFPFNTNGLGGVIQPRSKTTLRLKAKAYEDGFVGQGRFYLFEYDLLSFIDKNLNSLRVRDVSDFVWNSLSQKLISKVKTNLKEILYETMNIFSENGVEIYRIEELIMYHINRLDGTFFKENIIDSFEFEILPDELFYIRSYPSKFSSRNTKSANLGLGWTDNLQLKLVKIVDRNLEYFKFTLGGDDYIVDYKSSNNSYFSNNIQIELDERQTFAVITHLDLNLKYDFDIVRQCISRITTSSAIKLSVKCENRGKILEIYNSEFSLQFSYTTSNLYRAITRTSLNAPKETFLFSFDRLDRLIAFSNSESTTYYAYDEFHNLIKQSTDETVVLYEYDENNLLSRVKSSYKNEINAEFTYKYYDYGVIEVNDLPNKINVKYFYNFNGGLLFYEVNEMSRVNFIGSKDLARSKILINGELIKEITFDEQTNTVSNILNDAKFSRKVVYKDDGSKLVEYTDRLGSKFRTVKYNTDNKEFEEFILPNGLMDQRVFDLENTEMKIKTRRNDELIVKYDENQRRIFYSHATGDKNRGCSYEYNSYGLITLARGQNSYDSVTNVYDTQGKLIKNKFKDSYEIEYDYNDNSNVVQIRTNDNSFNMKYVRGGADDNINEVILNGETIATLQYSSSGYRLNLPKISRYFEYSFFSDTQLLSKYTIGDSSNTRNTISYEYEYNHRYLKSSMKLVTSTGAISSVSEYLYDNANRLVSIVNKELNTTISIVLDANNNRRKFVKTVKNITETYDYTINQLNQFVNDGKNLYFYDDNGNLVVQRKDKSNEITFNYYEDGKLYLYNNCTINYDCLERVSQLNCSDLGVFVYNYHQTSKQPISFVMPNGTTVFIVYIPEFDKPIAYLMNNIVYYFENNGEFLIEQVVSIGKIIPPVAFPNPDPFDVKPNSLNFDFDSLSPIINFPTNINNSIIHDYFILSSSYKPYSRLHNTIFGQLPFNPSISPENTPNQTPKFSFRNNRSPTSLNPTSRIYLDTYLSTPSSINPNNLIPPSMNPLGQFINRKNLSPKKRSTFSAICDYFYGDIGSLKTIDSRNYSSAKLIEDICEGIGAFLNAKLIKDKSTQESFREVLNTYPNIERPLNLACNGVSLEAVFNIVKDVAKDKIKDTLTKPLDKAFRKLNPVLNCLYNALKPTFPLDELLNWALPLDPNEIIGPDAYGPFNYISDNQRFVFTINFENLANVTAPAQVVRIQSTLNKYFSLATLTFIRYGFNDFEKSLDTLSSPYLVDTVDMEEYAVRIFAAIDPLTRELVWTFRTIDKSTGNIPEDASLGFLPPSNGTHGKGFIEFGIQLVSKVNHLTVVEANASIIFDQNEPIDTNYLFYTVDNKAPEATFHFNNQTNVVTINANDKESGVKEMTVFYELENVLISTNESFISFELYPNNRPYEISYRVLDQVYNVLSANSLQKLKYFLQSH